MFGPRQSDQEREKKETREIKIGEKIHTAKNARSSASTEEDVANRRASQSRNLVKANRKEWKKIYEFQ